MRQQLKRLPVYGVIFLLIFFICQVFFTPGLKDTVVRLQMQCPANDEYQLFYQNEEVTEFNEAASVKQSVVGSEQTQEIQFPLANQNYTQVRLDLGTQAEKAISIEKITFLQLNQQAVYLAADLQEAMSAGGIVVHDLELQQSNSDTLQFKTTGSDPYLQFTQINLQPIEISKPVLFPFVIALILTAFFYRYVYLKEIVAFFKDLYQNTVSYTHLDVYKRQQG